MNRPNQQAIKSRQLRPVNDRQHHLSRLDEKDKLLNQINGPHRGDRLPRYCKKHASHFTNHYIKEYSQWFPGKKNNVADSLSRDFDLDETEITKHLYSSFPSQLPPLFQEVPLPNEIESWLTSLLLRLPAKEQLREPHTKTRREPNDDGWSTSIQSDSHTIPTLRHSLEANATSSFAPLLQQSETVDFQATLSKP